MDNNNGLNASDIILGSALSGRGGYYGGGGAWGGGYYGGVAPFAGPASNAVRINRNSDLNREMNRATQFTLDQAEESRRFSEVCNRITQSELRNGDRLRDLEREINANARRASDCCCETQKEILRLDASNNLRFAELSKEMAVNQGKTDAGLAAIDAKIDANQKFNELFAENQALKTQVACGCVTGCSTPCNGG